MAEVGGGYQQGGYENGAGGDPHHAPQPGGPGTGGGGGGGGGPPHHTQIDQTHKIFVGGVAWQTTEVGLRDHFSKYGELLDVALMRDRATGAPRGFGFVTFKRGEGALWLACVGSKGLSRLGFEPARSGYR